MNYQFRARQCPAVLLTVAWCLLFYAAHTSAQDLCDVSFDTSSTADHCDSLGLSRGSKSNGTWGTLMQWSRHQGSSGGPDLNAPLVTDRPDFTEASSTVGRGIAQLEFGYTYTHDESGLIESESHSYPEMLLRYGILADWLEFRAAWNYTGLDNEELRFSGSDDLYLGFKIGLTPQAGILPEMALIPQMTVPTGNDAFTADTVLPGLNWIYGWELNSCLSTAGSTQLNRSVEGAADNAYTEWAQSWTVAASFTDRVGGYAEWYGLFPHSAEFSETEHYMNGGFTFLFTNDLQLDIRGGVGLNDASDDYFLGTGLSVRFQ